jgi:hypothetical protein
MPSPSLRTARVTAALLAALALSVGGCSPASVDAGQVGVKTVWGAVQPDVYQEGIYLTWVGQDIISMDARMQKKEASATASSKDLQVVSAVIALNYRIDTAKAPNIARHPPSRAWRSLAVLLAVPRSSKVECKREGSEGKCEQNRARPAFVLVAAGAGGYRELL